MRLLLRLLPLMIGALAFLFFEFALQNRVVIHWLVIVSVVAVIGAVVVLRQLRISSMWTWLLCLTPTCLIIGGWLLLIFSRGPVVRHFYALLVALSLWIFLNVVFFFEHSRSRYQEHSLENVTGYLNIAGIFLLTSGLLNLILFLGLPAIVLVAIPLIGTVLYFGLLLLSGVTEFRRWIHLGVVAVLMVELMVVVAALPTSVYVGGMITALGYYLLTGLSRNWLLRIQGASVMYRYLTVTAVLLIIILVSAKWF